MSQPTLSAWEGERKNPSVDSLIRMSELYGVSVDYLLGLPAERYHRADLLQPIPVEIIPIFHETPVFSIDRGWAMVDAIEGVLHFADGATRPLAKLVDTCYVLPPAHVIPGTITEKPLYRDELMDHDTNLLYSGAAPKTVQYLAGHKNSKITMDTYAKVKYNRPEQLLPVVDRAFSSEKGSENTTQTLE